MGFLEDQRYFGDDRDDLDAIYPYCASFVRLGIPKDAPRSVEVAFNPENEEEKKFFRILCYAYEDSFDWDSVPLVFRRSDVAEIIWRSGDRVVRKSSLRDGVEQFHEFTNEIPEAESGPRDRLSS